MQTVIITGNIGKDAETATRKDGSQYLTFRVAVDEGRDKAPTWYDVALYVSNPANLQQYLVKGRGYSSTVGSLQELTPTAKGWHSLR